MIPNSRTAQDLKPVYASSTPATEEHVWIQLPISDQPLTPSSPIIIDGIYAQAAQFEDIPLIQKQLVQEFEAWEAASDEALMLFEDEIS